MSHNVWAFLAPKEGEEKKLLHESIKLGKSRFGWSMGDNQNLKLENNWYSEQRSLLKIKEGDWIVHINLPVWGQCIAVKVCSEYDFDDGLMTNWGADFRHCFKIDTTSITEFSRTDPKVLPSVNLRPRKGRVCQKVKKVDDFHKSIKNLKNEKQEDHLKNKIEEDILPKISHYIHEMKPGKKLEHILAKVFREIPTVEEVEENGSRGGKDFGADLIIKTSASLGYLSFENTIIVQVKSYEGTHDNLHAVDQIKEGIEKFNGTAGMIITTAEKSEQLENKVLEVSDELGIPIDLMDAPDVARFIIKYAPDVLINLDF